MASSGLSRAKTIWFISHNNKQNINKHWPIPFAFVREGYGREMSTFVVLLLFSPYLLLLF